MKKLALLLASLLLCVSVVAKRKVPKRPRILGIAGVTILVSDLTEARKFYLKLIDPTHSCDYCQAAPPPYLFLPSGQRIKFEKAPVPPPASLLTEVSLLTDDLEGFKNISTTTKLILTKSKRSGAESSSVSCSRMPRGITFQLRTPTTWPTRKM